MSRQIEYFQPHISRGWDVEAYRRLRIERIGIVGVQRKVAGSRVSRVLQLARHGDLAVVEAPAQAPLPLSPARFRRIKYRFLEKKREKKEKKRKEERKRKEKEKKKKEKKEKEKGKGQKTKKLDFFRVSHR